MVSTVCLVGYYPIFVVINPSLSSGGLPNPGYPGGAKVFFLNWSQEFIKKRNSSNIFVFQSYSSCGPDEGLHSYPRRGFGAPLFL